MTALTRVDLGKLARICGMFSSNHMGERAAAAAKADAIVRNAGLTWPDLLDRPTPPPPEPPRRTWPRELTPAAILSFYGAALTGWEKCFLGGLAKRGASTWTDRQREVLDGIRARFQ